MKAKRACGAALAVAALALLPSCNGRSVFGKTMKKGESFTGPALVELNLSKGVSERGASTLFGSIPGTSHADLVMALRKLDPEETKGVFVRLGLTQMGVAAATEIGTLLKGVRDRNIPVYCHADELGNGTMLLTSLGCTEIWISPAGGVDTVGLGFELIFGNQLLKDLKIGVDFLQVGKYKGAQEPYTRNEPSPEARESIEFTLKDLRKAWIDGVTTGRGADVAALVEDGPYGPQAAKDAGLVDGVGYEDDVRDKARTAVGAERTVVAFGGGANEQGGFSEILRTLTGAESEGAPHVAVIKAIGAITMGGGGGLGGAEGITETGLGKVLTQVTEDDNVKAVVLRIDSPGGSALASDLLWHKLMKLRAKKPLIVSVGGMAASGGYYLSSAGTAIFAEPASIVGSIGVVGGKLALHDALAKYGINTVPVTAATDPVKARRATYMSPFQPWDDPTRAKVLASMEAIYGTFLDRIVEGRGLDRDTLHDKAAQGRIFGAASAKDLGLVDQLGGLDDAIRYAQEKGGLGADGPVLLKAEQGGLLELFGGDADAAAKAAERAKSELDPIASVIETFPAEVREWLASTAPMAQGEVALTAVPFVIVGR
ncbi:MAG: S49 family peptidase [Polyangiaceae bacterium]